MRTALLLCLLSFSAVAADDFQTAIIVGFQQAGADKSVDYPQIVVQIGDLHFTARPFQKCGDADALYIGSHPRDFVVGKVVMARINEQRGSLEVKVLSRNKPLRFVIERVEQIYQ
jgi:hypothetical protein